MDIFRRTPLSVPAAISGLPATFEDVALTGPARLALDSVRRDSSFGEFNGVPAYWFARAIEPGAMAAMWQPMAESVWVQRAIKTVSLPISSVGLDFYPRDGSAEAGPRRRHAGVRRYLSAGHVLRRNLDTAVDLPQVRAFLQEPVLGLSYADFVEASIGWMKLNECFWLLSDTTLIPFPQAKGRPLDKIIIAQPHRMRHVVENGELIGWTYTDIGGKAWTLLPDQVIQLRFWNPYNPWRGLGEYASARIAAEADHLCGKFERNLAANNGDTGPFIIAKNGVPSDAQREQMIAELRAKRQATLRGDFKAVFLTGDISVEDPQIKSVDSAFIASRLSKRHEIYAAFGVPMSMADVTASYSIGSASDWFRLISETCIPNGTKFCGAIGQLIRKLTGQDVEVLQNWDEHPVMQAVREERMKTADSLFAKGMPMAQIDEWLNLGLPDYEGKETGYIPFNLAPVGAAAAESAPPATAADFSEANPAQDAGQPDDVKQMLAALRMGVARERKIKNGKAIWEGHMRLRQKSIRLLQSKASKVINEFRNRALRKLAAHAAASGEKSFSSPVTKGLLDIIFDQNDFSVSLVNNVTGPIREALASSVSELLAEVGKPEDAWKMPPHEVLDFISSRTQKVQNCGQTVRSQLNTALEADLKDGKSIREMEESVKGVFNNLTKFEAKRIAMTEVAAAYGQGRHAAMKAAGIQGKRWLSSHGPNVREWHIEAEEAYGEDAIPVSQAFEVGGEKLMHPGDPLGSAGNVINCHCVELPSALTGESE